MNIETTLVLIFILIGTIFLLLLLHNQVAKEIAADTKLKEIEKIVTPPQKTKRANHIRFLQFFYLL